MNNPMLDGFIESIENTYGKYRAGMESAIRTKLYHINQDGYDDLLRHLIEDYDMARPPSLKVILGEIYLHKISLNHQHLYGVSICEFCDQEYSQNEIKCPKCQKIRQYGITKLVKYKPVWVDHEFDETDEDYSKEIQSITDMFNTRVGIVIAMTQEDLREFVSEREGKRIFDGEQDEGTAIEETRKDLHRLQGSNSTDKPSVLDL